MTSFRFLAMQVVHHLFPSICHTHYPAIAPIVQQTCKEFNVPYRVYPTVRTLPMLVWRFIRRPVTCSMMQCTLQFRLAYQ